jgi:hypothetical protein
MEVAYHQFEYIPSEKSNGAKITDQNKGSRLKGEIAN